MEQFEDTNFKLGCYSHISDFGLGGTFGLPGFHWNKNYVCYEYTVKEPADGKKMIKVYCPHCNKKIIIKVLSLKSARKIAVLTPYFLDSFIKRV